MTGVIHTAARAHPADAVFVVLVESAMPAGAKSQWLLCGHVTCLPAATHLPKQRCGPAQADGLRS